MAYNVETIGARAVIAAVTFQKEGWLAVAVVECHPFGHGAEGLFHQARGNPHPVPFRDKSAGLFEQINRFLMIEANAGSLQDFEAGVMQLLALFG